MPRAVQRQDDAFTLIEVLVAMVLLGSGVVALITALGMNAKTTFANRNQAQAASTLAAAAEYVKGLAYDASGLATCGPGTPHTIDSATVPHDAAFTVSFGPALAVGSTPCTALKKVPVYVKGDGFNLKVDVLRRPTPVDHP